MASIINVKKDKELKEKILNLEEQNFKTSEDRYTLLFSKAHIYHKIKEFEKKYPDQKNVPRPPHWSGWRVEPDNIEFWLEIKNRIHERLNYRKKNGERLREIL